MRVSRLRLPESDEPLVTERIDTLLVNPSMRKLRPSLKFPLYLHSCSIVAIF